MAFEIRSISVDQPTDPKIFTTPETPAANPPERGSNAPANLIPRSSFLPAIDEEGLASCPRKPIKDLLASQSRHPSPSAASIPPTTSIFLNIPEPESSQSRTTSLSFAQGFRARMTGAAPVQVLATTSDLICCLIEAVVGGGEIKAAAKKAGMASGVAFAFDSLFHLGTSTVFKIWPLKAEPRSPQASLDMIHVLCGALANHGPLIGMATTSAVAKILQKPITNADLGMAVLNGMISSGVVTGTVFTLYNSNARFRAKFNSACGELNKMLGRSSSPETPPQP